jgi:hypothetical protein
LRTTGSNIRAKTHPEGGCRTSGDRLPEVHRHCPPAPTGADLQRACLVPGVRKKRSPLANLLPLLWSVGMSNSEVGEAESRSIEMRVITRTCRRTGSQESLIGLTTKAATSPGYYTHLGSFVGLLARYNAGECLRLVLPAPYGSRF